MPAGLFEDVWRTITNTQHLKKKSVVCWLSVWLHSFQQWAPVASDCKLPVNVAEVKKKTRWCQPCPILFDMLCSLAVGGLNGRREGGRRQGVWSLQLFAMTAINGPALHSSTWYSCKNSFPPLRLSPSGRDNALPCFTGTSCEVSCLINRTLPVMLHSCFGHGHWACWLN